MQSWVNSSVNIYKVKIMEDMLATGKVSNNIFEDYYTIVKQNGEMKLNIGGYINQEKIDRTKQIENITLKVINRQVYKDYEIYNVEVSNESENTILLDDKIRTDSIYLLGENGTKYLAYSYELDNTYLTIEPHKTTTLKIKFNKMYTTNSIMNAIVFEDVIKNYEEYNKIDNKNEYQNKTKLIIEI